MPIAAPSVDTPSTAPPDRADDHADVVVLGAPRSGTSLVAQLVASAGVGFGDHLLPASPANPRGFLEDVRVTELNDELLAPHVVAAGALPVPDRRLAWAGAPAADAAITADDGQRARMADLLGLGPDVGDLDRGGPCRGGPVGVKDPRFVWTLDAWEPVLRPGTALVAVVRHPAEVAASLVTMAERDPAYWSGSAMTVERGLALWEAVNRRLLARLDDRWLVLEHGSLLDGRSPSALAALAGATGRPVDGGAVDPDLRRSPRRAAVPAEAEALFAELSARAERDAERWSARAR